MPPEPLYPLKFHPIYKEKVWGGRTLEQLGRKLPGGPELRIGESWEVADLAASSASGGGGGAERSIIADGPLAGSTLHEAIALFGEQMLGRLPLGPGGEFPLLVKYLDARENLSLQVHPSPDYCHEHPEAFLKSEAWYVVAAEPGAVIYKGLRAEATPQDLRAALARGTDEAVRPLLVEVPVKAGDCHYLPSGTLHALGAGVLVAEVQTPSDTTFRVYDWGRRNRELHLEQAMRCIRFGPADTRREERRSHIAGMFTTVSRLVLTEHFRIEKVRMREGYEQEVPYDQPAVWMVLEGRGRLIPGPEQEPVPFGRGETLLVPAGMADPRLTLEADTVWLEVTFPKALPEQIA